MIRKYIKMKRNVKLSNAISILVGCVIGNGLILLNTKMYENAQGPYAAVAVWGVCGLYTLIGAICLAELGSCIVGPGGEFTYIQRAFGPLPGFLSLWVSVLVIRPITLSVIAFELAKILFQPFQCCAVCRGPDYATELLASVILCLMTALNSVSVRFVLKIQNILTLVNVMMMIFIISHGLVYFVEGLLGYHFQLNTNAFNTSFDFKDKPYDLKKLWISVNAALFSFTGWNFFIVVTQEMRHSFKTFPRAVWIGLPLLMLVYIFTNVVFFITTSPNGIIDSKPLDVFFENRTLREFKFEWLTPIFLAMLMLGGINGNLFTSARMLTSGAVFGPIPHIFSCIHQHYLTPTPGLFFQCSIAVVYVFTGFNFDFTEFSFSLIKYISFFNCLSTGTAVAALIVVRRTDPDIPRPIRVSLIFPYLYIGVTILIITCFLVVDTKRTGHAVIILATGIPAFFCMGWISARFRTSRFYCNCFLRKLFNVAPEYAKDNE